MRPVGVFYATREGHTRRIAEYVADGLRARGFDVEVLNLAGRAYPCLETYGAVVLAASVHAGQHEKEMTSFVRSRRESLDALPSAFLSVTLSEAGAERANATEEERSRFTADVEKMLEAFFDETGWRPKRVKPVAGALLYSKYNFFLRFIMKRIARKSGGDTDTSRDYVYTDWGSLDRFIDEFCGDCAATSAA